MPRERNDDRRKDEVVFSLCFCLLLLLHPLLAAAGEPVRLTETGRLKFSPVFREQGRELVFVELTDPSLYRIQRLTLADGSCTPLHPEATTSEFEPASAADGQCDAYLRTRSALSIAITVRDGQGNELGEIAPEPGFFGYRSPTLAPNRSRVAYAFAVRGAQQIVSSKLNGDDRQTLTDSPGLNNWPAYSPDGQWIVFGSSRDGNFEIYRMRADGSDVRRLTNHPLQDIRPRFSPNSQQIVFTSHRDGNAEIYVMNVDGSGLRRMTDHPERDDYPDWHPDGKSIVTVSERGGKHELYLWPLAE